MRRDPTGTPGDMSVNSRVIKTTPEQVWNVLSDGWLYPVWVVGATRMRDVDESWPQVGAKLHHSAGVWPLVVSDDTEVLECEPRSMLRLRARGSFLGEAEVVLTLSASGAHTLVEIREDAVSGPGTLVPEPLRDPMIKIRNVETLRRLAFIAEHRAQA
jgi:uncharacterized protein YndB with AHSA1/START domain